MAEEGDVLAEGSTLVEREEDLDELRRSTAALTKMMQTVLQRIDAMASVQGEPVAKMLAEGSPLRSTSHPVGRTQRLVDVLKASPAGGQRACKARAHHGQREFKARVRGNSR